MSTFEWTASFAGGGRSEGKEGQEGKEGSRPRLAALIPLANAWRVEMSRVETSPVESGTHGTVLKSTGMISFSGKSSRLPPLVSSDNQTSGEGEGEGGSK